MDITNKAEITWLKCPIGLPAAKFSTLLTWQTPKLWNIILIFFPVFQYQIFCKKEIYNFYTKDYFSTKDTSFFIGFSLLLLIGLDAVVYVTHEMNVPIAGFIIKRKVMKHQDHRPGISVGSCWPSGQDALIADVHFCGILCPAPPRTSLVFKTLTGTNSSRQYCSQGH